MVTEDFESSCHIQVDLLRDAVGSAGMALNLDFLFFLLSRTLICLCPPFLQHVLMVASVPPLTWLVQLLFSLFSLH